MDNNPLLGMIMKKICEKEIIKGPNNNDFGTIEDTLKKNRQESKSEARKLPRAVEACFIGPRGQNADFFQKLVEAGVNRNTIARKSYEMEDANHITRLMKNDPSFLATQDSIDRSYNYLLTKLRDLSPPFYSARYFGHMCWETSIPSMIGYFATMLYNPNNCAFEAGPFTTQLEIDCMKEFAIMFGYPPMLESVTEEEGLSHSWGHFTCGGTVANCEAFWAARSCKFLAFALRQYVEAQIEEQKEEQTEKKQRYRGFRRHRKNRKGKKEKTTRAQKIASGITVMLPTGESKDLMSLSVWELLNVSNDETLSLNDKIFQAFYPGQPDKYSEFQDELAPFTVGKSGLIDIYNMLEEMNVQSPDAKWPNNKVPKPLSFCSATGHYSIQKSLSLLGIGEGSLQHVEVNLDTRMDTVKLEARLNECLEKHIPVMVVVGIVGSTEESTVDNLKEILAIKQRMAAKGLFFHFHIDGAYGSYFVSMIRKIQEGQINSFSSYTTEQLEQFCKSDSITFDPHKTGYVPYACGGIFYRNYKLRNNLSFSAPYIFTGLEPNVSIYGIEGSKPGAAVASVYMSLEVMPLERSGHGQLLERTMANTKIFTSGLYVMKETQFKFTLINGAKYTEYFNCCVLPRSYVEKHNVPGEKQAQDAAYRQIAKTSLPQIQDLIKDPAIGKYYYEVGPDLNIVCYAVNFIDKQTGKWNTSLKKLNIFNKTLVKISKPVGTDLSVRCKDLYVSETEVSHKYGEPIFNDFLSRYQLVNDDTYIELIRSTIMNPFFTQVPHQSETSIFVNELAENSCEALDYLAKNGWN